MEDYLYGLLNFYKNLPLRAQYLIGWIYNLLPVRVRYGAFYSKYMQRIKSWEADDFDHGALLAEIQSYALQAIPYYRENSAKERGLNIITKEIITGNKADFIADDLAGQCLKSNTGGTSGTPFEFFIHKGISRAKEKAHFDWYWGQFGYSKGDRVLMIRGAPLKDNALFEYIAIDNKLSVTCYELTENNIAVVVEAIKKFKPSYIHGYPSALKILTLLLEKTSETIKGVRGVFLGSEYLAEQDREYFEAYYSARVINWYGHSELLVHAGNCLYSNEYHIYPFYGHVDLVDNGEIIEIPNKAGKIIATGFDNNVMPLLQYDTGDLAEYSENDSCKCGFKGRSFAKIYGREQNYIMLNDRSRVSVTAFVFGQHFSEFSKMREIQLVQENINELEVHIVPNEEFTNDELFSLREKMTQSVSGKINISIELVDSTKKTPSGKHKILIQKDGLLDD